MHPYRFDWRTAAIVMGLFLVGVGVSEVVKGLG